MKGGKAPMDSIADMMQPSQSIDASTLLKMAAAAFSQCQAICRILEDRMQRASDIAGACCTLADNLHVHPEHSGLSGFGLRPEPDHVQSTGEMLQSAIGAFDRILSTEAELELASDSLDLIRQIDWAKVARAACAAGDEANRVAQAIYTALHVKLQALFHTHTASLTEAKQQ